jgi:hypothetical protein
MAIQRMDNVAIVADHLDAAVAFFTELAMELECKGQVEGRAGQQTNPDRRAVLTCKEPAAEVASSCIFSNRAGFIQTG